MNDILENLDLVYWMLLASIISAGGFMRGFSGFGTTLVMVPLLSLLMLPSQAVLLALSIDVLVMIPIFPKAAKQAEWKPIIPLVVGALIAIPLGTWILVMASPGTMRIIISIMVLMFAFLLLSGWSYNGKKTKLLSFIVGIFSGTANGATAIGGPPIAVYFIAKGMSPVVLRASLNVVAFIMQGLTAIAIYSMGSFDVSKTISLLIFAPLMLTFVWLGSAIFKMVDSRLFNKLMLYFLISFAAYILIITIYDT